MSNENSSTAAPRISRTSPARGSRFVALVAEFDWILQLLLFVAAVAALFTGAAPLHGPTIV